MSVSQIIEAPVEVRLPEDAEELHHDRPWVVIVWNDPINLMSYVTFVLRKLFGYSEAEATRLMLQVHNEGKAVVVRREGEGRIRGRPPARMACGRRSGRTDDRKPSGP